MEKRKIICTTCPVGCGIEVDVEDGVVLAIRGNHCKRGAFYAEKEITAPVRMLTTTVRVEKGDRPLVSVKTKTPIPKALLMKAMAEIDRIKCSAPVLAGQVLSHDLAGTGVELVATCGAYNENEKPYDGKKIS